MDDTKGAQAEMKSAAKLRSLLAIALLVTPLVSWAAFPSVVQQGDATLKLNGEGVRYRLMFKVYKMALYTPSPAATPDQLLSMPGPKRIAFEALRELPGTNLGLAFIKGLSANSPRDMVQKHVTSTNRLIEIFSGRAKLLPGDSFAMEYLPGKGTQFYILNEPQGAPVGDEEFFRMVLRIWVGPSPADHQLKERLLAESEAASRRQ